MTRSFSSSCAKFTFGFMVFSVLLVFAFAANAKWITDSNGHEFQIENGKLNRISNGKSYPVTDVISAQFQDGVSNGEVRRILGQLGLREIRHNILGIYDFKLRKGADPIAAVEALYESGLVEFAETNSYGEYVQAIPNDPNFGTNQWHLNQGTNIDINAPEACQISLGTGVLVGVLDSGVDIDHEDLINHMWQNPGETGPGTSAGVDDDGNGLIDDIDGWDFNNGNNDPNGPNDHGTHVAGIVASSTNNGLGGAGVAGGWGATLGASLMPLGVGDAAPNGAIIDDAILYAVAKGARIIQFSLTVGDTVAIRNAIDAAIAANMVVVCAAGNNSVPPDVGFPALYGPVIAVSATTSTDTLAGFSNFGPELDVAAPGAGIWSTEIGDTYDFKSGTSMAAPVVSGIAALLLSFKPTLTNVQIETALETTAVDLGAAGFDNSFGNGRVDAFAALASVNIPPVADANGPYSGDEGSPINFDGSGSTDLDGSIISYQWDWENDGAFDFSSALPTASHTYSVSQTLTVALRVTDNAGASDTDTTTVTVNNVAPIVNAGPDAIVDEGSLFSQAGSFTDPGADIWTATVDYGDGTGVQALPLAGKNFTLNHVYADNGVYTVTVTVSDNSGGFGSDDVIVTVNNVVPTVDAGPDQTVNEGDVVALDPATFNDKGTLDNHTATIDWDDGSPLYIGVVTEAPFGPPGSTLGANGTVDGSHVYGDNGTYTVTVTVTDDDGGVGFDTLTIEVLNVPPTVDYPGPDQELMAGDYTTFDPATYSDPGWLDTHTAGWDFGDPGSVAPNVNTLAGVVTPDPLNPPNPVTGTVTVPDPPGGHSYFGAGDHTVTVTVTDDDGGSGSDTLNVKVEAIPATIVFDPETLNRKGGEKWVIVYIELPIRGDVKKIDLSSILLNDEVEPETNKKYGFVKSEDSYITDVDEDGELERMVMFPRKAVQKLFKDDEGEVEVVVTGCVEYTNVHGDTGCADFKGTDAVEIIDTPKELAAPARVASVGFQALDAFPQPCNPDVWIPYTLGKDVEVKVSIYSSSGKLIRALDLGYKPAGSYASKSKAAHWDGKNGSGERVSSGIYFFTIKAGDQAAIKKIVVTK